MPRCCAPIIWSQIQPSHACRRWMCLAAALPSSGPILRTYPFCAHHCWMRLSCNVHCWMPLSSLCMSGCNLHFARCDLQFKRSSTKSCRIQFTLARRALAVALPSRRSLIRRWKALLQLFRTPHQRASRSHAVASVWRARVS